MILILLIVFIFLFFLLSIFFQDEKNRDIFHKSIKDIDASYCYILKLLINCKNEEQINIIFNWGINVLNEKYKFYLNNIKNGFINTIIYNNIAYYTLLLTNKRKEILNNKSYINKGTGSDLIYYWDY